MRAGHEYATHARALAKANGVRMLEDSGLAKDCAHATPGLRIVTHAPIVDDTSYIVSLHEMGHIVHPNGLVRDAIVPKTATEKITLQIVEEEAAWDWAEANALEWTAGMAAVKTFALKTYTDARAAIGTDGGFQDFAFAIEKAFGDMFSGPPMTAQVQVDPEAGKRMAPAHAKTAASIVAAIRQHYPKKGGR